MRVQDPFRPRESPPKDARLKLSAMSADRARPASGGITQLTDLPTIP